MSLNNRNQHKEVLAPRRASVPAWKTVYSGKAQRAVDPWFRTSRENSRNVRVSEHQPNPRIFLRRNKPGLR